MNLNFFPRERRNGYVLVMVLFFSGISLAALAGALRWCSDTARTTERNNRYFSALSAAEASTEMVLSSMAKDYQSSGEGVVYANLGTYADSYPTSAQNNYWGNFEFSDAQGHVGKTYVTRSVAWAYTNLESQYTGLSGLASTYRIISNAKTVGLTPPLTAAVKQEVQVASIPIFQFAIFY